MRLLTCTLSVLLICILLSRSENAAPAGADDKEPAKTAPKPIPVNMHDFMQGMFQVPYRRLKTAMVAEPRNKAGWKAIRSDSLILAEGSNLLLMRLPEKDSDLWSKYSVDSRDAGADLVKAAKAKDFPAAKKAYVKMLSLCNACHVKFENGKHIMKP